MGFCVLVSVSEIESSYKLRKTDSEAHIWTVDVFFIDNHSCVDKIGKSIFIAYFSSMERVLTEIAGITRSTQENHFSPQILIF